MNMTRTTTVVVALAAALASLRDAENSRPQAREQWRAHLENLAREFLPKGPAMPNGTQVDLEDSSPNRIVLLTNHKHVGGAQGTSWTHYRIVVEPSFLQGFSLAISGRDEGDVMEQIEEALRDALLVEVTDTQLAELMPR